LEKIGVGDMVKLRAVLLALTLMATSATAVDLRERDKLLHFAGSAALSTLTYIITDDAKTAIAVGLGVGLAKELYDSRKGGTGFSKDDLVADTLGVAAGMGLMFTYKYGF
jgi:putative lipoprotein